jgi:hypothetical protein
MRMIVAASEFTIPSRGHRGRRMSGERRGFKAAVLKVECERRVESGELALLLMRMCCDNADLVEGVLAAVREAKKRNLRPNCPFPDGCAEFPCRTLHCYADVCSNGYAYRMS